MIRKKEMNSNEAYKTDKERKEKLIFIWLQVTGTNLSQRDYLFGRMPGNISEKQNKLTAKKWSSWWNFPLRVQPKVNIPSAVPWVSVSQFKIPRS